MTATLADFLLARIAEDVAVASRWPEDEPPPPPGRPYWLDAYGHPIWGPRARVLAECETKRQIVGLFAEAMDQHKCDVDELFFGSTLLYLALPYADHPDYDESWKP